ncbi:hypothetical protein [Gilliamella sp. wkB112]|uniref:hypothetical protein n=1 Tax=Gilliamella sp. wkB112 TaxID=3120257 RepID=UPI00159ED5B8|nr:hypothetical protein [Gilliamella apicola]
MNFHKFSYANALIESASELDIKLNFITHMDACNYIDQVLKKYMPWRIEGHLAIGDNAKRLSTDDYEFKFSLCLDNKPGYIFFEQNTINKDVVVIIEDARNISKLMENSSGMEYFISDKDISYLISVNWYSIEYVGNIELIC